MNKQPKYTSCNQLDIGGMKNMKKLPKWFFAIFALLLLVGCTGIDPVVLEEKNAEIEDLNAKNEELTNQQATLISEVEKFKAEVTEVIEGKTAQINDLTEQLNAKPEALPEVLVEGDTAIGNVVEVVGEYYTVDELLLGQAVNPFVLDNNELSFLIDTQIEFDDEDIDVQEKIYFDAVSVETSLNGDDEFKEIPTLTFDANSIEYQYQFDDLVDFTLITEDEPLVITMLGKEFNIVEMDATGFTFIEGDEFFFKEGETKEINGKQVSILTIGDDDEAYISVDNVAEIVSEGDNEEINDLSIRVKEIIYTAKESGTSYITLTVGNDVEQTIDNGDEFIEDDERFEWIISTNGNAINYIGILLVEKANDYDENVLYPNEIFDFAGLFEFTFGYDRDYDYNDFKISFDDIQVNNTDIDTVKFESKDGKKLTIGDEEVEKAYFDGVLIYYKDNNNDWVVDNQNILVLENDDVAYPVSMNGNKLLIGPLELDLQNGFTYFGLLEEDAESTDLIVNAVLLGGRDEFVLLEDGTIIDRPEDVLDDDELEFSIPDKNVEMTLKIGK